MTVQEFFLGPITQATDPAGEDFSFFYMPLYTGLSTNDRH